MGIKDKKILYELDKNSRIPYSKIAKAVRLSQETVRYRVNNLIKNQIINKFFTVIDPAKLGYAFYKVMLKLHNIDNKQIQNIIKYLKINKSVVWLTTLDGSYDIGFVVKVSNIIDLNNLIDDLNSRYNKYINKKKISINISGEYLTRDYLIKKERDVKTEVSYTARFEPIEIDSINKSIIQLLTDNSRISAIDMAQKLNISADSVIQRMKKLEKEKIITRYNIVINNNEINQIQYKVLIYLNNVSPEKIKSFVSSCRSNNKIIYIIKSLGEWDYELDLEVNNVDEFRDIMINLTKDFSEIINDYDALIINKVHKYNLYP